MYYLELDVVTNNQTKLVTYLVTDSNFCEA